MSYIEMAIILTVAPILGGLINGLDRKITARMQGRLGPPILQPFYDFFKLLGKEIFISAPMQYLYVFLNLIFTIYSLILFVLRKDLLIIVFIMAFASISLVLGSMSVKSPYSRIGGQREMIQIISYEPVLIFLAAAIFQVSGSFEIQKVIDMEEPLLLSLPLVFIAFIYILTIKLRKSPFDVSTSHHAHQELVKGMLTEYSGPQLALIELAHWYELVLLVGFLLLFYATNIYVGIALVVLSLFLEILVDNLTARLHTKWMFESSWIIGVTLCTINILWLYFR